MATRETATHVTCFRSCRHVGGKHSPESGLLPIQVPNKPCRILLRPLAIRRLIPQHSLQRRVVETAVVDRQLNASVNCQHTTRYDALSGPGARSLMAWLWSVGGSTIQRALCMKMGEMTEWLAVHFGRFWSTTSIERIFSFKWGD